MARWSLSNVDGEHLGGAAVTLVFGLFLSGLGLSGIIEESSVWSNSLRVEAAINNINESTQTKKNITTTYYQTDYVYQIDGASYRGRKTITANPGKPGDTITAEVSAGNHSKSRLTAPGNEPYWYLFFGILSFIATALALYFGHREPPAPTQNEATQDKPKKNKRK